MLKPSKDILGYTQKEIISICKKRNIDLNDFYEAFGVNTCSVGKDGTPRYYQWDIERALDILGHEDGKYHEWD